MGNSTRGTSRRNSRTLVAVATLAPWVVIAVLFTPLVPLRHPVASATWVVIIELALGSSVLLAGSALERSRPNTSVFQYLAAFSLGIYGATTLLGLLSVGILLLIPTVAVALLVGRTASRLHQRLLPFVITTLLVGALAAAAIIIANVFAQ